MVKPTLILLHGIGGGPAAFGQASLALEQAGFDVRCWAHPGYPWSASQPAQVNGMACSDMTAAAEQLESWLAMQSLQDVVLIGHSLGGMVALAYLAADLSRPHARCRAAVLAHSSAAFGHADGAFQAQFIAQRTAILDAGGTMHDLAQTLVPHLIDPICDPDAFEQARALMSAISPASYRTTLQALVHFDQRSVLPQLRIPVLGLAAGMDTTAPATVIEKMVSKIPRGRYVCLPGLGHLAPMQAPLPWAQSVTEFLSESNV
jgi:3-oxoadipate enol-lactonase